jgi:hypothetical protein
VSGVPPAPSAGAGRSPWVPRAAAIFLLIFAFLPLVNWIPGSHEVPWYRGLAGEWVNGTAIVIGAAAVLTILSRRFPSLWPETWLAGPRVSSLAISPVTLAVIVTLAFALYAGIARVVFDAHPLVIDEIVQTFQAQILAGGRLWLPVPPHPEFVSELNIIDRGGKMYSHFPVGGPAMLALGELIHVPWLVNPVAGALSVALFAAMASTIEPGRRTRLAATVLFAFAPFTAFMAGSYMNHVTALTWLLLGLAGLAKVTATEAPRPRWAFACGLGFGCSAAIRPIDAAIFAVPAGLWLFVRAGQRHMRVRDLAAAGLGLALPLAALMWANLETTGAPLRFGYQVMWGGNVGLGFHPSPWGVPHSPLRGLVLLNLYFIRLQTFLYETPLPSLVPVIAALALTRRLSPFDRYLLATSGLLVGAYFAYWHDGYYLGPRFMYPLLPALVLWTARLPRIAAERFGGPTAGRAVLFAYLVSGILALGVDLPIRARQYHAMFGPMRWDVSRAATAAGVRNAVVFVRETWGAQLLVRMWALGVHRADAERIYNRADACVLDHAITTLERAPGHVLPHDSLLHVLDPTTADSSRLVRSSFSPDTSERFLPGHRYTQDCVDRINEDRGGTMLLAPLLPVRDGNIYVRDLHERNAELAREYPDRKLFLLRPPSALPGIAPAFSPLPRDSLLAASKPLVAGHD